MNETPYGSNDEYLDTPPPRSRLSLFIDYLTPRVVICQLAVMLAMGISFWSDKFWWADLFSHFYFQYFWASGLTLIFALLIRYKTLIFVALGSMAVAYTIMMHSLWLYPRSLPIKPVIAQNASTFRIAHINTLTLNKNTAALDTLISTHNPDIINIQEANALFSQYAKASLKGEYPYQLHNPRADSYGTMILSKLPITGGDNLKIKGPVFTTDLYRIELQAPNGQKFNLFSLHTIQPLKGAANTTHRNLELMSTAKYIKTSTLPAILAGDLNMTTYSSFFRNYVIRYSQFQFLGQGEWPLTPTWPVFLKISPLQIPIDHMLYDPKAFAVKNWHSFDFAGSDHKGLLADFAFVAK